MSEPTGRELERELMTTIEACGFDVWQPPKAKYAEQDIFGLYDLLAFGHSQLLAVQCKGGRDAAGVHDWFDVTRPHVETLPRFRPLFVHRAGSAWRVAEHDAVGWSWQYDGRQDEQQVTPDLIELLQQA
jgi:Holliday junction resolvase